MTFWQENYQFIKEVYEMRHTKMAEWMENVEKSISRIMADKVYTSSEFKRERDNFHVCINSFKYEKLVMISYMFLHIYHFQKLGLVQGSGKGRYQKVAQNYS